MDYGVCQLEVFESLFEHNLMNNRIPPLILDGASNLQWVPVILPSFEHDLHARSMHSQFFLTQEAQGLRSIMQVR